MKKFKYKLEKLNSSLNSLDEIINFSYSFDLSIEKIEEAIRDSIIKNLNILLNSH